VSPRRRASARAGRTPAANASGGARALSDPREIEKLAMLMAANGLAELEIETGGEKLRLVRSRAVETELAPLPIVRTGRRDGEPDGGARPITSPMVGTFHRARAPEAPAFVEVGDVVECGQVLCVVEAMKMMNEIEAEFRGRVVRILIENGCPIEYGEPLFLVEPV
jgi:biotin carboxyl carrier protein